MKPEVDRIPAGLWVPMPIPAIKFLVSRGHRQASRILYAIVLHKGATKTKIFPSYETINLYSGVGENNIRVNLDILETFGFIRITKGRDGKKERNYYEILDLCYQMKINPKAKSAEILDAMICSTCWDDVEPADIDTSVSTSWDGKTETSRRHKNCQGIGGYGLLTPINENSRQNQRWQKSILDGSFLDNRNETD